MKEWVGRVAISNDPGGDRDDWEVQEKLTFYDEESGYAITVLPGARTDGASIPRFFWRVIGGPFSGRYIAAALIHDQLYKAQGAGKFSRKAADQLFKRAMLASGVPGWKAEVMYSAVRMGGEWALQDPFYLDKQRQYIEINPLEISDA